MSRVRSKGNKTTEERLVGLLKKEKITGWRRHYPLVGKPDFVWLRPRIAVFVDGCFWHGHDCGRNLSPKTNVDEWAKKIALTKERDAKIARQLGSKGWTVIRIWECDLRKYPSASVMKIKATMEHKMFQGP
jgi:DNA mismatch endonuclease (patch repair protein)